VGRGGEVNASAVCAGAGCVLAVSSIVATLRHDGIELLSKAPELAPGLEAASWSDHEASAMTTGNPGP
jgi:hypothetical protein